MVVQMINVGETTGALDAMLSKIADFYEEEVDTAVAGLLTLMEPIMIAFLGVVVGGIVIAMYMPIFDLIEADRLRQEGGTEMSMTIRRTLLALITAARPHQRPARPAILIQIKSPGTLPVDPFFFLIGLTSRSRSSTA